MQTLLSYYNAKYTFWTLIGLIFLGSVLYVTFVNVAVFNVADRLDFDDAIASLEAETSHLEFEYIALAQSIDIERAYELGFTETDSPHYVVRGGSGAVALGN